MIANKKYILLNPHISDFIAEPVIYKFIKRRPLKKYGYLLEEPIKNNEVASILVDSTATSIIPMGIYKKLPYFLRLVISKIEIKYWKKINNLSAANVSVFFNTKNIDKKFTLVFLSYKNYKNAHSLIKTCNQFASSIVHISHYHNEAKMQSEVLSQIKNIVIAADTDITNSPSFLQFYQWYTKPVFILPFQITERFISSKSLQQRIKKAIATGTFHKIENHLEMSDFRNATGANSLHPLRRTIFENKEKVNSFMDVLVSPFFEPPTSKKIWKSFFSEKINASQKNYFSFNIVDKYNEYLFAVVGEEFFSGLPGIGAFEAMACGCILIGHPNCYENIGMVAFEHYIPQTTNTLEEIQNIIEVYKDNIELLEKISNNGIALVKSKFSPTQLFHSFSNSL